MKSSALKRSFFLFILISLACSKERPLPSAYELLERSNKGEVKTAVLYPPTEESFYSTVVPTGTSSSLSLGERQGYQAKILLSFGKSQVPDSSVIESARITLVAYATQGEASQPFYATMHRIADTSWNESTVTWDNFNNQFALDYLSRTAISVADSDSVVFDIDISKITDEHGWLDSTFTRQGVLIKTEEGSPASFIKEFYSTESYSTSRFPTLELIYSKGTTRDTSQYVSTSDAFIVKSEGLVPEDRLYVGRGIAYRSLLKFDVSSLPENATINRAYLKLVLDRENSVLSPADSIKLVSSGLMAHRLTSSDWEYVVIDSTVSGHSQSWVEKDTLSLNIGSAVQGWSCRAFENYGLLIRSTYEGQSILRVAFFSSKADSLSIPKLILNYTLPPSSQF